MARPRITFTRRNGGLGRQGDNERSHCALVMSGVDAANLDLNTVAELNSVNDARALGIDEDYDIDNTLLVFYHISEFFRMCPTGKLFIELVSQATTLTQMADLTSGNGLAHLLRDPKCKGKVRFAGIARNPAAGFVPTVSNGLDEDSLKESGGVYTGAVVKAQALAEEEADLKRPVSIFVEGRSMEGSTADLIDATQALCPNVQLVALQDNDVQAENALYSGHAAVGTVLGLRALYGISKSIANPGEGNPGIGNIQDGATERFLNPGLSSDNLLSAYTDTVSGDQDVLYDKGFLIPALHTGYNGVYLNSDRTCDVTESDYSRGARVAVVNEWERIVYKVMVPKLEAALRADPATGYIDPLIVKAWEADINAAASKELSEDVSSAEATINPAQDFLSTDTIDVEGAIVPLGYAKTINVKTGFDNPFAG